MPLFFAAILLLITQAEMMYFSSTKFLILIVY